VFLNGDKDEQNKVKDFMIGFFQKFYVSSVMKLKQNRLEMVQVKE